MTWRSAGLGALPGAVLLVGGILISVLADRNDVLLTAGLTAVGIGSVWLVSLLFYAVGRSEDRERERLATPAHDDRGQQRDQPRRDPEPAHPPRRASSRPWRRPERRRGDHPRGQV